jgi:hypothetical protein
MKIKKEENDLMILTENSIMGRAIGCVFLLAGLFLITFPQYVASKIPLWLSVLFIIGGAAAVLLTKSKVLTIDKNSGKIMMEDKSIVNKNISEYLISDVKSIKLGLKSELKIEKGGRQRTDWYWLELSTTKGDVEISSRSSQSVSVLVVKKEIVPERNLGQKIAAFLNVPFVDNHPESAGEIISDIANAVKSKTNKNNKL